MSPVKRREKQLLFPSQGRAPEGGAETANEPSAEWSQDVLNFHQEFLNYPHSEDHPVK